ncbi:MAG TPA: glycosyltransferase [Candidatus Binatia bacterium]|nr:glycosyltransferase [Candidatus Binatia bacterium]
MDKDVAIIIPSYNDAENIPLVVKGIRLVSPLAKIIIVDDSNEKQKKKLRNFVQKQKGVSLIERVGKGGRGSAVLDGFKAALKDKNIQYVFEMDADTSHTGKDLPKFYENKKTADLIIGSRYLKESKVVNWPKKRLYQSMLINSVLLNALFHLGIRDYTNGYRMYNRKAAKFLIGTTLHEKGFLLLSESAYKLKSAGYSLAEVPITFTDRKYGESSVQPKDLITSLYGAFKIRFIYK